MTGFKTNKSSLCSSLCFVLPLVLAVSGATAASDDDDANELSGDSTSVSVDDLPGSATLGRAAFADLIGRVDRADLATLATRAVNSDNATSAQNANHAAFAVNATRADTATNALQLGGYGNTHFTNASNFSSGTLDLDRLIGELVNGSGDLRSAVLDSGTYSINISGNAATATNTNYASTAGSAGECTGGSADCDSYTYLWKKDSWSGWGACSGSPSYEIRTRNVYCGRSDKGSKSYSDSKCSGSKPKTTDRRTCTLETFDWWNSGWSSYSACSGGQQTRTRTVECRSSLTGNKVSNSKCSSGSKPDSSYTRSCTSYEWWRSSWGSYGTCNGTHQYRYRTVECRIEGTSSKVSDGNCSGSKPSTSSRRTCTVPDTYSWWKSSWGSYGTCNGTHKYRYRTVECRNDRTGSKVSDGNCTGSKPATSSRTTCSIPDTYSWWKGAWGPYGTCNGTHKYRYRTVECRNDRTGSKVSDGNCTGSKPTTSSRTTCSVTSPPTLPTGGGLKWQNGGIRFGNPIGIGSHCPSNAIGKSCGTLKAKCLLSRDAAANTYKFAVCDGT